MVFWDLRIVAMQPRRTGWPRWCCAPMSPACRSSGSTTGKRRDCTIRRQVAYTCGSLLYELYGGVNARSGARTVLEVNSIVATVGHTGNPGNTRHDYVPPLNNQTLFRRDANLCMYCGAALAHARALARSHRPFSQGGRHVAQRRGGLSPLQQSEGLAHAGGSEDAAHRGALHADLRGVHLPEGPAVLADQMEYLLAHFPRTSPLHARAARRARGGDGKRAARVLSSASRVQARASTRERSRALPASRVGRLDR